MALNLAIQITLTVGARDNTIIWQAEYQRLDRIDSPSCYTSFDKCTSGLHVQLHWCMVPKPASWLLHLMHSLFKEMASYILEFVLKTAAFYSN